MSSIVRNTFDRFAQDNLQVQIDIVLNELSRDNRENRQERRTRHDRFIFSERLLRIVLKKKKTNN